MLEFTQLCTEIARLLWEASPILTFAIGMLTVVQAVFSPVELLLTKVIVDRTAFDLDLSVSLPEPYVRALPLAAWIALTAAMVSLGRLLRPLSSILQEMAGDRLSGYIEERMISAANSWPGIARFEDPHFADDLEIVRAHAGSYTLQALLYSIRATTSIVSSIGMVLVLERMNLLLPAVLLGANLPQMAQEWLYRSRTRSHIYVQTPQTRKLRYHREAILTPESAKDVRLYGLGAYFRKLYATTFNTAIRDLDRIRKGMSVRVSLSAALAAGVSGAAYVYLVHKAVGGNLTVGDLALYGGAIAMLASALQMLAFDIGFMPMAFGTITPALTRILNAPPDLPVPKSPTPLKRTAEGVVFRNVSFQYPGTTKVILKNLSFQLRRGECIALVGHNGAGKTTAAKLLLRLYDPTEGSITLDGLDLREYDPEELRRRMGAIFQDFAHYELTAGENIGMGRLESIEDEHALLRAAERAGALNLIRTLPEGLDTRIGRQFGGREISGGEWQKLALARAFLRNSELLILDEPTASLDVETEYGIYKRFHELTSDKVVMLISHRFSTVRMADRILFLECGQLREEGTHEELLMLNGEYAQLYRLQSSQYTSGNE